MIINSKNIAKEREGDAAHLLRNGHPAADPPVYRRHRSGHRSRSSDSDGHQENPGWEFAKEGRHGSLNT